MGAAAVVVGAAAGATAEMTERPGALALVEARPQALLIATARLVLASAGLVQRDDKIRLLGGEVGGRVVERKMPILPDADKGHVNGRSPQCLAGDADDLGRILFSVEQEVFCNSRLLN
ncbi:MAG: hypothetical protein ACXVRE_10065 [Gaiellaceae bacterium]